MSISNFKILAPNLTVSSPQLACPTSSRHHSFSTMSGDDTADLDAVAFATVVACAHTVTLITEEEEADVIDDHRSNPRAKRTKYDKRRAWAQK